MVLFPNILPVGGINLVHT